MSGVGRHGTRDCFVGGGVTLTGEPLAVGPLTACGGGASGGEQLAAGVGRADVGVLLELGFPPRTTPETPLDLGHSF